MNDDTPNLTPTQRIYNLGMAALTKPPRTSTQNDSVTYKQVATGDLKGQWIIDELTIPRREDETLDEWSERQHFMLDWAHRKTTQLNSDAPAEPKPKGEK